MMLIITSLCTDNKGRNIIDTNNLTYTGSKSSYWQKKIKPQLENVGCEVKNDTYINRLK